MATNADSETETVQNENVNSGNLKGPQTGKQRAVKRSFHEGAMGVDQVRKSYSTILSGFHADTFCCGAFYYPYLR